MSRTGPVGQGSGEKRAGNLNFVGGAIIEVVVLVCLMAVNGC